MCRVEKWKRYKYAVAAIIVIMVFCAFMLSYIAVILLATAPATKALSDISISNFVIQPFNSTPPPLLSFSTGSYRLNLGQGYLNVTNTGNQNLTLMLTMSAEITAINSQQTNYSLGSIVIPITINAHNSAIVPATLNDTTPVVHWTQRPSGYWGYSWSVQASITTNYLLWHPIVGYKTYDFNGTATIL